MVELSKIKRMELSEIQGALETMTLEELGRTLFWLNGFMSEQDREYWDKFCEGVQSSPYFPEIDRQPH